MEQISNSEWFFFPWSPEHQKHHGASMIHPDDLDSWNQSYPYGGLFECVMREGEYLVLRHAKGTFRAKPELFRIVNRPAKRVGDAVEVESKGERKAGTIVEIQWHHQKNEPFYFLMIDGKKSSKRYWDSDFL